MFSYAFFITNDIFIQIRFKVINKDNVPSAIPIVLDFASKFFTTNKLSLLYFIFFLLLIKAKIKSPSVNVIPYILIINKMIATSKYNII